MHYARLPVSEASALAAHRTQAGWEVCTEGDQLWVRAASAAEEQWQMLPFVERFTKDFADRLTRVGQAVPVRRAPEGPWTALAQWLPVPRSASLAGGVRPPSLAISPVRSADGELAADLLLLRREDWEAWVLMAPEARLAPLRFALASDGRVCVRGRPPPPLAGAAWVVHDESIALRAGWGFPPAATPAWLARLLDLPQGAIALWHEDGSAEVLPPGAFVPATRANVRASAMGMAG